MENNNQIKAENNFSMPVDPNINASLTGGLKNRIDEQNSKAQHPKGRTGLFIFIVILFVILGVGGWWYYAQGQVILLNQQMKLDLMQDGKNNQLETSFEAKIKMIDQDNTFLGKDITISGQGKQYSNINDFDAEVDLKFTKDEDVVIDIKLLTRSVIEKFYLKLKITGLEDLGLPFEINIEDKWIVFDADSMNSPLNPYQLNVQDSISVEELKNKVQNLFDELKSLGAFKISNPHQIIDNNGETLRKIKYNVKESKVKDLLLAYAKYYSEITTISVIGVEEDVDKTRQEIQEEAKNELLKFINEKPEEWNKIKKYFTALDIYLWINTDTKNIQGLEVVVDNLEILDEKDKGYNIILDYKSMLSSVESRKIDSPINTQSIEEFMANLMGGVMSNNNLIIPDDTIWNENNNLDGIDTDGDGLSDAMEAIYGTDINNPDSDGDGYLDGEEVNTGHNPLKRPEEGLVVLSDDYWILGDIEADVTIIEYSDYDCPFCARFHTTMHQIVDEYNGNVRWAYRHFPLVALHPDASRKAEAAECVGKFEGNEAFWKFSDKLYEDKPDISELFGIVKELGYNNATWQNCMDMYIFETKIDDQIKEARAAGGKGTPFSLIIYNGVEEQVSGALSYENLKNKIDNLLKK